MYRNLSLTLLALASGAQAFQSPINFGDPLAAENPFTQNDMYPIRGNGITQKSAASASFFDGQTAPRGDQYFKAMFAGGFNQNGDSFELSNEVKVYDPKYLSWSIEKSLSVARFGITSAVTNEGQQGNKVIFVGGLALNSKSKSINDMLIASGAADIYSANTGLWKSYPNALSAPRFGMSSLYLAKSSNEVLFVGGFEGQVPMFSGSASASAIVDAYNPATDSWSKKSLVLNGGARGNMAVGRCYTRAYDPVYLFFGGSAFSDGKSPSNVVDIFDEVRGTWATSSVSVARSLVGVATASSSKASNAAIFAGGFTGTESVANVDIFRTSSLNSLGGTWSSTVLPEPMSGLVGATYGSAVVFAGGSKRTATSETPSDSVFVYSNGKFTTLKLSSARSQAAVAIASFIESTRIDAGAMNYIVFVGGKIENGVSVSAADVLGVGTGTACKAGEYRDGNSCSRCAPGHWGDAAAALGTDPTCSGPCAAGRFGDNLLGDYHQIVSLYPSGLLTSDQCSGICLPGYNCPAGSVSAKQSVCPTGSFSDFGAGKCTSCPSGTSLNAVNKPRKIHLTVAPDINDLEFSWSFKDSKGEVLLSQGRGKEAAGDFEFDYNGAPGSEISFQMLDGGGDGLCCKYGGGSYYEISVDGVSIHRGGKFAGVDTHVFQAGQKRECVSSSVESTPVATSRPTTTTAAPVVDIVSTTSTSVPIKTFAPPPNCEATCHGQDLGFPGLNSKSNLCLRYFTDDECLNKMKGKLGGGTASKRECLGRNGGSITYGCKYSSACCSSKDVPVDSNAALLVSDESSAKHLSIVASLMALFVAAFFM